MATQDAPDLYCVSPAPCSIKLMISPRSSCSSYWRMVLRNQTAGARYAVLFYYIYLSIYLIFLYILRTMNKYWDFWFQPSTWFVPASCLLDFLVISFSDCKESSSHHLQFIDLFFQPQDSHRYSLVAQLVKNRLQCRRPWFVSWVGKIH